jgi:hypothetical protein
MSDHKHHHDLSQADDFTIRFSCEARWERFADERSDPELGEIIKTAVINELARRASNGSPDIASRAATVDFKDPTTKDKDTP